LTTPVKSYRVAMTVCRLAVRTLSTIDQVSDEAIPLPPRYDCDSTTYTSTSPRRCYARGEISLMSQTLTIWPATLRLDQAAMYSGLSVDTFKEKCPVRPIEFTESARGHRYLRIKLDDWLLSLDPNTTSTPAVRRFGEATHGR